MTAYTRTATTPAMRQRATRQEDDNEGLERGLHARHVMMLAVGGSIGVGLFMGTGTGIALAGPSLILAYACVGLIIFLVMRSLGELLMYRVVPGGFADYAREFLGPAFGFVTSWGYWITWSLIGMSELTVVAQITHGWLPNVPQWAIVGVSLAALVLLNLAKVGVFGEAEFWFASIKVAAIIVVVALGVVVCVTHAGAAGADAGLANLFAVSAPSGASGFFPYGLWGFLMGLKVAVFSYQGSELIGMSAAEAEDAEHVLPRAINAVPARILLFYVCSLAAMMSVVPWTGFSADRSPFIQTLDAIGVPVASTVMGAVVITSALSSCSSGALYSNARLLMRMAHNGIAPRAFASVSGSHVPANGVFASAAMMVLGVVLNAIVPERVFSYLMSICTIAALWTWGVIIVCGMVYRRRVACGEAKESSFPMPHATAASVLCLAFFAMVVVIMAFDPDSRMALAGIPLWGVVLMAGYRIHLARGAKRGADMMETSDNVAAEIE
ncbi:amino acid permease [Bifidobacterium amazonense]|uniref:Amino acid permease n=1 Tax=Bifidobacterium amazonense TaxID=2809027 RepID=A0ABS9VSH7_9BIFI|nr:amino acid permease [Bifidobacterium amazonense]MCH9275040.1 amino acid permease [Bifidobacterium amazonense]